MKKLKKVLAAASMLLLLSASLFADPPKKSADPSLSVVEALQNSFRSISNTMLPAVVEVDVTETKTYTDPFGGMSNPFEFFFGSPRGKNNEDDSKKNQREYEHITYLQITMLPVLQLKSALSLMTSASLKVSL